MTDILQKIVAVKQQEVAVAQQIKSLRALREEVKRTPPPRNFAGALRAKMDAGQAAVIAEIKKASPSKGVIRTEFDPAAIAASYARGNGQISAACLSVLTDKNFFQGAPQYLQQARSSCNLPVLRKDFMIDAYQIYESRSMGADCVLLIAACLDDARMHEFVQIARELDMAVLIEVHNERELERTLLLEQAEHYSEKILLGINNRNLRTFEVSLQTTLNMLPKIPAEQLLVTESGILASQDVNTMRAAGVHAFLVGETFMRASDPGLALADLFAEKGVQ